MKTLKSFLFIIDIFILLFCANVFAFSSQRGLVSVETSDSHPYIKIKKPRANAEPLALSSDYNFAVFLMDHEEICLVNLEHGLELHCFLRNDFSITEVNAFFSQDNSYVKLLIDDKSLIFDVNTGRQEKTIKNNEIKWNDENYLEKIKEQHNFDFSFYAPGSSYSGNNLGYSYKILSGKNSFVVYNSSDLIRYSYTGDVLNVYNTKEAENIYYFCQQDDKLVVFYTRTLVLYDIDSGAIVKSYNLTVDFEREIIFDSIRSCLVNMDENYVIFIFSPWDYGWRCGRLDLRSCEFLVFYDTCNEEPYDYSVLYYDYDNYNNKIKCRKNFSPFFLNKYILVFFTIENQVILFNIDTFEVKNVVLDLESDVAEYLAKLSSGGGGILNDEKIYLCFYNDYNRNVELILYVNLENGNCPALRNKMGKIWGNIKRFCKIDSDRLLLQDDNSLIYYNLTHNKLAASYNADYWCCYEDFMLLISNGIAKIYDYDGNLIKIIDNHYDFAHSEYAYCSTIHSVKWSGVHTYDVLSAKDGFFEKELYSFSFLGAKEYLTYTPEGFFTGTEWACKNLVYIVDGLEVTELNQLYDKLYRPDLIAAKARGEDISEYAKGINFASLVRTGKEPTVSFRSIPKESTERKIKFEILVKDNGGGIGEVTLWRDGQSYLICQGYPSTKGQTVVIPTETELFPPETKIEASAYNRARTIESKKAEKTVKWTGTVKRPNLFLLTIAVNDYYIDKYRLRCAVPDAKLVAETVEKYGGIFKSVKTDSLLDSEVTKDNFDKKFSEISSSIDTDDVFILFFAGHGTEYDIDKTYYFLPYDCILTNINKIPEQGISTGFIQKNLSKIKAQKKMIILDTCQSGAFTNKVATRDINTDILILDRFKKSTGTATFMASSSEETAKEGYKGHGIFSYFIAEGLSGKADYDGDGYVRLKELDNYLCKEVYEQSQKIFTTSQLPVIDSAGMDFVLSKTK